MTKLIVSKLNYIIVIYNIYIKKILMHNLRIIMRKMIYLIC